MPSRDAEIGRAIVRYEFVSLRLLDLHGCRQGPIAGRLYRSRLQFEPFIRFRDWLAQIRDEPGRRMLRRRNGRVTHLDNGSLVHGPFTMATRREVLERLLDLQREVGSVLVTEEEIDIIRRIRADDVASGIERSLRERDQARVE